MGYTNIGYLRVTACICQKELIQEEKLLERALPKEVSLLVASPFRRTSIEAVRKKIATLAFWIGQWHVVRADGAHVLPWKTLARNVRKREARAEQASLLVTTSIPAIMYSGTLRNGRAPFMNNECRSTYANESCEIIDDKDGDVPNGWQNASLRTSS